MTSANKCNDCFIHHLAMHFGYLVWHTLRNLKTVHKLHKYIHWQMLIALLQLKNKH